MSTTETNTLTLDKEGPLRVRRMIDSDAGKLAMKLSDSDKREVSMLGYEPFEVLKQACLYGNLTIEIDGEPEGAFGLNSDVYPAAIWLLGSAKLREYPVALTKLCKRYVEMWGRKTALANIVPADHEDTIRWLKSLDFSFDPEVYNVNGYAFRRFQRGPLSTSLLH